MVMKRILFLLVTAAFVIGCSDDDSKTEEGKFYVDMITVEGNDGTEQTLDMDYNAQKQLVKMTSGGTTIEFTYEENRLKTVTGGPYSYYMTYEDGKLAGLTQDQTIYDVEYNSEENSYVFGGTDVTLNQYNDVTRVFTAWGEDTWSYDTSKKGSAYSFTTENNFLIGLLLNLPELFTSRPVTKDTDAAIENTYDSNGYVIKAVYEDVNGAPYNAVTYTYIKL
jgi:hypothetical protein